MRLTFLLSVIGVAVLNNATTPLVTGTAATCSASLPSVAITQGTDLRGGNWEFTRTAPMDPINNPTQSSTITATKCITDVTAHFKTQVASLQKFCTVGQPKKEGNTYVTTSVCDAPSMKVHVNTTNTTVIHDAGSYDSTIETSGTIGGKPAKWTEKVVAKRVGDCPGS